MFQFKAVPASIALCGVLGREDDQDELNKRFGLMWKRIPNHPRVLYVNDKTRDLQMTLMLDSAGKPVEFAVYTEIPFEEFKLGFGTVTFDCTYHEIDPLYKHIGLQVVKVLKEQGLW